MLNSDTLARALALNRQAASAVITATKALLKQVSNPTGMYIVVNDGPLATYNTVAWGTISADAANQNGIEGYYIQSSTNPSLGFQLAERVVRWSHFGAIGNYIANDLPKLQACNDWWFAKVRTDLTLDVTIEAGVLGTLNLGPAVAITGRPRSNIQGNLHLKQLGTGVFETVRDKGFLSTTIWRGGISIEGNDTTAFSARTNAIGITLYGNALCRFEYVRVYGFWFHGINCHSDSTHFDDEMVIGSIDVSNCGSGFGIATASLLANWSNPVRNGGSGSQGQYDTITVDALPDPSIETYRAIGAAPVFVNINGNWYYVSGYNRAASTINIYPSLYAADYNGGAGSGKLRWCFGSAIETDGGDSFIKAEHLHIQVCGIGLSATSLYGPRVDHADISSCGIAVNFGAQPANAVVGSSMDGFYYEGNDCDALFTPGPGTGSSSNYMLSTYTLSLSKTHVLAPLDWTKDKRLGGVGRGSGSAGGNINNLLIGVNGYIQESHDYPIWSAYTTNAFFQDHGRPPRQFTQFRDSQTIAINIVDEGYNRLFGYRGGQWCYVGSGVSGAPAGTFTWTPPTQSITGTVYITTTTGSAIATMASTAGLSAGMPISGAGIPANTTILSVDSATQVHLSANAITGWDLTKATVTGGATTNGSAIVTMQSTAGLVAGMPITGTGIPASTTILSVDSGTQIHLSANATATGVTSLTVTASINGAFGNAVFSGFYGPVEFEVLFTDYYQLQWLVWPKTGWRLKGSATWTPAAIASGAASPISTITVTGAALGDRFDAAYNHDLQGLALNAWVSAANTVSFNALNLTGGLITPASGTVTVSKVA